ncbi:hypothetical protein SLS56_012086 [Neofusicoccum ribis]|uniref:Protein kinase domain-containing protein n=1 Tax=Neofusicoccum ribis TaxID=45134 RepID=A0ABR3S9T0_9PEZI
MSPTKINRQPSPETTIESRRTEYLREWRPGATLGRGGTASQQYDKHSQPLTPHKFIVDRLLKRDDYNHADLIVDMFEWHPDTPSPGECTILMPRATGDLHRWIKERYQDPDGTARTPDEGLLRHIFLDLAKAVAFMHSGSERRPSIVHRDIKPGNVLIFTDPDSPDLPTLRLADLGSAREVGASRSSDSEDEGSSDGENEGSIFTPGYTPPEFEDGQDWATSCDVFSLGATIHYCVFRRTPYIVLGDTVAGLPDHHTEDSVLEPVSLRGRGWCEESDGPMLTFSNGLADILASTLDRDPDRRPSAASLVRLLGELRPIRSRRVVTSEQVELEPEWV